MSSGSIANRADLAKGDEAPSWVTAWLARCKRHLLEFTGSPEREVERDFRARYFRNGMHMLAIGGFLAGLVFGSFWLLDLMTVGLPAFGGIQSFRIAIVVIMFGLFAATSKWRESSLTAYPILAHLAYGLGMFATVWVAYQTRMHSTPAEMYWAMTSSLITATVVLFGTSSLTAYNTLALSLVAAAAGVALCLSTPAPPSYVGRLSLHLLMANVVCFALRLAIQRHEVRMFFARKEREENQAYTRELEAAKAQAEKARAEAEAMRAAAEAADKAKSVFLTNMSHEIRSPVNGLLGLLKQAQSGADPQTREQLQTGEASTKALLQVLDGILNFTAHANTRVDADATSVDLTAFAQTIRSLHGAGATSKGLEFSVKTEIDVDAKFVKVNEVRLFEMANNLVGNAFKYTDHGRVEFMLRSTPSPTEFNLCTIEMEIRDTGIGLSRDEMKKLFTPFWQGNRPGRRRTGTGLGLPRVKQIVDSLKGSIDVDSVEGLGTQIVVTMPLAIVPYNARPGQDSVSPGL